MALLEMKSVRDADVAGKRVLLRTSLNVPIAADGSVGDVFRLQKDVATIEFLVRNGAKIILVGYIGREGGTLAPVAKTLQTLIPSIPIAFTTTAVADVGGEVAALKEGTCLMLENIRKEPGEEKNDATLAANLAKLADIFVDDAFPEAHRAYASNVGVASLLPAYAGLLLEEEVVRLSHALVPPAKSLAIIGGAKFETKQPLLEKLLTVYPNILLGGALANDLLKARGLTIGTSLISDAPVPEDLVGDERILMPDDVRVDGGALGVRVAHTADVRADEHIVDIGTLTEASWSKHITEAEFVLWNGPMGIYEKGFVDGTDALAEALVNSSAKAVIGGGDTAAALAKFTFDPARIFVSTGGGAMLEFLANGGTLPALEVLKK